MTRSLYIGKTASGSIIEFPNVSPCLTDISGDYSYMSWEGDIVGIQNIVRLYNSATGIRVEKAVGQWADRATLSYQFAQP